MSAIFAWCSMPHALATRQELLENENAHCRAHSNFYRMLDELFVCVYIYIVVRGLQPCPKTENINNLSCIGKNTYLVTFFEYRVVFPLLLFGVFLSVTYQWKKI